MFIGVCVGGPKDGKAFASKLSRFRVAEISPIPGLAYKDISPAELSYAFWEYTFDEDSGTFRVTDAPHGEPLAGFDWRSTPDNPLK